MVAIIVRDRPKFGKTRSEQARNLQKEWGGSGMTDEQIDKCRHLEKRLDMREGFVRLIDVDRVR